MNYKDKMKQDIRLIARRHYEAGNHMRCYKEIWRRYVLPRTGICYRTFLKYVKEHEPGSQSPSLPGKS